MNLRFLLARSLASGIVRGGERPEFVDTSREENRDVSKAGKFSGFTKKPAKPGAQTVQPGGDKQPNERPAEDIQRGYEELFQ